MVIDYYKIVFAVKKTLVFADSDETALRYLAHNIQTNKTILITIIDYDNRFPSSNVKYKHNRHNIILYSISDTPYMYL